MICNSCGANSENTITCDFCGSSVSSITTAKVVSEKFTKRAQLLNLEADIDHIYEDPNNHNQVFERLLEKVETYIEKKDLKKAEFLASLATDQFKKNAYCTLKLAEVNVYYALRTSGSVQTANVKQKYIITARSLLNKHDYDEYADEKNRLEEMLDSVDGQKADQWGSSSGGTIFNQFDENPNRNVTSDSGCGSAFIQLITWVSAIIIAAAYVFA